MVFTMFYLFVLGCTTTNSTDKNDNPRERISINEGWKFMKYESETLADKLIYDVRPPIENVDDTKEADSKPTEAVEIATSSEVLKPYILPTANPFIKDSTKHHKRPQGNPGENFPFVQTNFDDNTWETVDLPHDWAIKGPFMKGDDAEVGGGMGRLPSNGAAWYRKQLEIPETDKEKSIFLDIDGAMSYAMVWLNGHLVGGWPYGYNSWRLDLTPYIKFGESNQLAIRIDNPNHSARWYPGGGIYRNVWLTKTNKIHVGQWGTYVTSKESSKDSATIDFKIAISNDALSNTTVDVVTEIYPLENGFKRLGLRAASIKKNNIILNSNSQTTIKGSAVIKSPKLWGPPPTQTPNLYKAITTIHAQDGTIIDNYETVFGIREVIFDGEKGLIVNGEPIKIQGVNQHHDLGALGAAFNLKAAKRQLETLKELGCNAIRMAHNPPAPELLELTDQMGFLVIDEIFDSWERKKTPHDFHLIFDDWLEADTRSFVRRDRNHPSVILWSFGNEVGEQYTAEEGAKVGAKLSAIVKSEDPSRPTTASMNYAKPNMPFPSIMDVISLNYQGEGIRDAPAYAHLQGIKTSPLYPAFYEAFPNKAIISSETAAALSSRGTYLFPVTGDISSPISDGIGGDPKTGYVSSYELYTANFGSSADKVFASQDKHPFVAGEFVWSGWDYLGEPTPYYSSRSSYFGLIDLAGFKKDRFYLYQARWRPDLPMVHILPHWNWPERIGQITPVHIFTSGDEVELFLNGKSLGRKKKGPFEYRLRWDDVVYKPGTLKAVAYKNGQFWSEETVHTTREPSKFVLKTDQDDLLSNGKDLVFITVKITDNKDHFVANANNPISFTIEGPGEIVATDNGDPTDLTSFASSERNAFNGLALVIIKAKKGAIGQIKVTANSSGLQSSSVTINCQ
ncbi:beta-galactosidase GalB [Mangrovimonas xylaniphaga]|uniref:beta-galactosidase GalB n=1 Tax=Mangrovimonas xylaniphaga TaxID=1645915 RepID=UPI0006B411F9|nr:beta-galactosidase GalB [Mangrovimonas xylaniphaga]